jgi:hypothetical protein
MKFQQEVEFGAVLLDQDNDQHGAALKLAATKLTGCG